MMWTTDLKSQKQRIQSIDVKQSQENQQLKQQTSLAFLQRTVLLITTHIHHESNCSTEQSRVLVQEAMTKIVDLRQSTDTQLELQQEIHKKELPRIHNNFMHQCKDFWRIIFSTAYSIYKIKYHKLKTILK